MKAEEATLMMPSAAVDRWVKETNEEIVKRARDDKSESCVPLSVFKDWRQRGLITAKTGMSPYELKSDDPLIEAFLDYYKRGGFEVSTQLYSGSPYGFVVQIRWRRPEVWVNVKT